MTGALLLGVDGGGSKTAVRIARLDSDGQLTVLGEGVSGPSNAFAVGVDRAIGHLREAVHQAHRDAGTAGTPVACAVLALAGSGQREAREAIERWAHNSQLARSVHIVHDADPVLAAGSDDGFGIALIVGTGSVAMGRDPAGRRHVTGGWGYWFGDAGSGYDLGRSALAAMAHAVDRTGPATALVEAITTELGLAAPQQVLRHLNDSGDTRRAIATLARVLLDCASAGDAVALEITRSGAEATARLVEVNREHLNFEAPIAIAAAGGIVCGSALYRDTLLEILARRQVPVARLTTVDAPVAGSLVLARRQLLDGASG